MIKKGLQIIKIILPIALAAMLVYLAFRDQNAETFWRKMDQVDFRWVAVSLIISLIPYVARAYRWNLLLTPLGYTVRLYPTTLAILIGYFANLAVPRLGELLRCGFLQRHNQVPITVSLGSVIAERAMDMLVLFALIALSLILEFDVLYNFLAPYFEGINSEWVYWTGGILLVAGSIGLLILIVLLKQGRFPRLKELASQLIEGLLSIRKVRNPIGFIAATLVMWIVYYFMSYVIVFSMDASAHLTLQAGLLLLVTGGIAIALPVQSGFGTYHTMIPALLLIYSVPADDGLFLATLLHSSQIVAIALLGGVALILGLFLKKEDGAHETKDHHPA